MKRIILGVLLTLPMLASAAEATSTPRDSEAYSWARLLLDLQSTFNQDATVGSSQNAATDEGGNTPGGCGFLDDNTHRLPHECEEK